MVVSPHFFRYYTVHDTCLNISHLHVSCNHISMPLPSLQQQKKGFSFYLFCANYCSSLVSLPLKPISLTQSLSAPSISLPSCHDFQPISFDVFSSHLPKHTAWEFSLSWPNFCRALALVLSHHSIFLYTFPLNTLPTSMLKHKSVTYCPPKILDSVISLHMRLMVG